MKKLTLLAALILAATSQTSMAAQDDVSAFDLYCPITGDYAELIMTARQTEMPKSKLEDVILGPLDDQILASLLAPIIEFAYAQPRTANEAQQSQISADFGVEMEADCFAGRE